MKSLPTRNDSDTFRSTPGSPLENFLFISTESVTATARHTAGYNFIHHLALSCCVRRVCGVRIRSQSVVLPWYI
jgi:hypothetical protein